MRPDEIPGESIRLVQKPSKLVCPNCRRTFDKEVLQRKDGSIEYRCPYCGHALHKERVDYCD